MSILIRNLSYTYRVGTPFAQEALKGVDLQVEKGEFVAIIGHTGCGKSTLMEHLNGLLRPTDGQVVVNGIDTAQKQADLRALRRSVGLVFQYPEYQLFEETVAKDVAFGPRNMHLAEAEIQTRVRTALGQVGLDVNTVGEKSPFDLSGGQRRRVAIAGVLAMEPEILVLDEPSAGLDPGGRREMMEIVSEIHRTRGITVMLVTHNMEEAARVAQRVLVMNDGQILMDGTPQDVYAQEEKLRAIGLDVPVMVRLAAALRRRGIAVPPDVLTPEDMCAFLRREGHHV